MKDDDVDEVVPSDEDYSSQMKKFIETIDVLVCIGDKNVCYKEIQL